MRTSPRTRRTARAAALGVSALAAALALTACGSNGNGGSAAGTAGGGSKSSSTAGGGADSGSTTGGKSGSDSQAGDKSGSGSTSGSTSGSGAKSSTGGGSTSGSSSSGNGGAKSTTGGGSTTGKAAGSGTTAGTRPAASGPATGDACTLRTGWNTGGDAAPDMHATQTSASIHFTNAGTRACALRGFPGVDLVGGKGTWSLVRSGRSPVSITLQPGETTDFSITMLPATEGSAQNFPVSSVRVTPPNSHRTVTLSWPWDGELVGQDAATHPGTYVNPVGF